MAATLRRSGLRGKPLGVECGAALRSPLSSTAMFEWVEAGRTRPLGPIS